jgi:WD40 repeat protein
MSCAWNASGTCFAAGNQDGSVCVWDVRMQRLLAKLHASRAVRSVKFSRGAVDLLVYSEHENACHVVDARTFHTEQVCVHPLLRNPACAQATPVKRGAVVDLSAAVCSRAEL